MSQYLEFLRYIRVVIGDCSGTENQQRDQPFQANKTGSGCSKLTTLLVNISLKFQMLISEIWQFFVEKM